MKIMNKDNVIHIGNTAILQIERMNYWVRVRQVFYFPVFYSLSTKNLCF